MHKDAATLGPISALRRLSNMKMTNHTSSQDRAWRRVRLVFPLALHAHDIDSCDHIFIAACDELLGERTRKG